VTLLRGRLVGERRAERRGTGAQSARPTLTFPDARWAKLGPLSDAERAWVTDNIRLLWKAVYQYRPRWAPYADGGWDALGYVLPYVVSVLRGYDPARGFTLPTYLWVAVRRAFARQHVRRRGYVPPPAGEYRRRGDYPVLFGLNTVEAHDRPEPDVTALYDAVADAYAALRPRQRQVLDALYGLSGPSWSGPALAASLGLSRARVYQLAAAGLGRLATALAAGGHLPTHVADAWRDRRDRQNAVRRAWLARAAARRSDE
jgi:hypothetical protein